MVRHEAVIVKRLLWPSTSIAGAATHVIGKVGSGVWELQNIFVYTDRTAALDYCWVGYQYEDLFGTTQEMVLKSGWVNYRQWMNYDGPILIEGPAEIVVHPYPSYTANWSAKASVRRIRDVF